MIPKVFTPHEVAEHLRVSVADVHRLVERGELPAFGVLGEPRIREDDLAEFIRRPLRLGTGLKRARQAVTAGNGVYRIPKRNRNPERTHEGRERVIRVILARHSSAVRVGTTKIEDENTRWLVRTSTTKAGPRDEYWFGFPQSDLQGSRAVHLVPVINDPAVAEVMVSFEIPILDLGPAIHGFARDRNGNAKFYIRENAGRFVLDARGMHIPLELGRYKMTLEG